MSLDIRISPKRAVSVYGLNRYPFTLYAEEWNAVFASADRIFVFIARHHLQLSCRCSEHLRETLKRFAKMPDWPTLAEPIPFCKKSQKGAVSLYGVRRFPLTLYCDQWMRVLAFRNEIEQFIQAHREELDSKGCGVPRPRRSEARPLRTVVGPDNIIRPVVRNV